MSLILMTRQIRASDLIILTNHFEKTNWVRSNLPGQLVSTGPKDQNTNLYSFACLSQAHRSHVSSQVESMFTLRSQEPKNRSDFLQQNQ